MKGSTLVIVESPTKAMTLRKFLPSSYEVLASLGHVRDLPSSSSQIPQKYRKQPWAHFGLDVTQDFHPIYVTLPEKGKVLAQLKKKLQTTQQLYLATDEDREGESIAWHLVQLLRPKIPVKRMVFHEITQEAIVRSLENTRDIDMNLVHAQEARRFLDRLYGYTLSPLLWKTIAYGLSAGRVQSPGLNLLADKEWERMQFASSRFFTLKIELQEKQQDVTLEATLKTWQGKKVATAQDFDPSTSQLIHPEATIVLEETSSQQILQLLPHHPIVVKKLREKITSVPAPAPYITSTLQQDASRTLNMSTKQVMQIAQALYEKGHITYMRTDSTTLAQKALQKVHQILQQHYPNYRRSSPKQYSSNPSSQEAHEAIRPSLEFLHPDKLPLQNTQERVLYTLIYHRTLASQMQNARRLTQTLDLHCNEAHFTYSQTYYPFLGFLKLLEPQAPTQPPLDFALLKEEQVLSFQGYQLVEQHTQAPRRFTEASFIQRLEKENIGRPSTYVSIIQTLLERQYIHKKGNTLIPTIKGLCVNQFLIKEFPELLSYRFTSRMEDSLDSIAMGKVNHISYLHQFYDSEKGLKTLIEKKEPALKEQDYRNITLPQLPEHPIRLSSYGSYVALNTPEGEQTLNIPPLLEPDELTQETLAKFSRSGALVGYEPVSQTPIFWRTTRYGEALQLGESSPTVPKPKIVSIPKGVKFEDMNLTLALKLLSFPQVLGYHPETQEPVIANLGPFGPYVKHQNLYVSIRPLEKFFQCNLEKALGLLTKKAQSIQANTSSLGINPRTGKEVFLKKGRFYWQLSSEGKQISVRPNLYKETGISLVQALKLLETQNTPKQQTRKPSPKKTSRIPRKKTSSRTKAS